MTIDTRQDYLLRASGASGAAAEPHAPCGRPRAQAEHAAPRTGRKPGPQAAPQRAWPKSSTSCTRPTWPTSLKHCRSNDRLLVWDLVKASAATSEILLEVSDAVRETLIESMDREELVAAAEQLDTDELADLAPDLPSQVVYEVMGGLDVQERAQLESVLSYEEDQVGSVMDLRSGQDPCRCVAGSGVALPAPL